MRRLRPHLTYANVVATLALVLAVSGGTAAIAITASKNSVTTKSIQKGAVRAKNLGPVVVRTQTGPGIGQGIAKCAKGERVIGGGGIASPSVVTSVPLGNGWQVNSNGTGDATAYALCLRR